MTTTEKVGLSKIQEIIGTIEGVVGVAAWQLAEDGAKEPLLINADQLFPTASTIKIPVLYELYRQSEAGMIDLNMQIEVREEHLIPGSGVLQDLGMGLKLTVRDLAVLMTVVSDNSATDMILDLIGREQVENTMQELGLNQIEISLTLREMILSLAGLDAHDPNHTYKMAREIFERPDFKADPSSRALGETDNDLSSPHDLAQLLTLIAQNQNLSQTSCEAIIDILSRQKFNQILPLHLPPYIRLAHKTGSLSGVRNDAGIVFAPSGTYVVVLMTKQLANEVDATPKLARISEAIYQYFS